jgi:hypothetical protein
MAPPSALSPQSLPVSNAPNAPHAPQAPRTLTMPISNHASRLSTRLLSPLALCLLGAAATSALLVAVDEGVAFAQPAPDAKPADGQPAAPAPPGDAKPVDAPKADGPVADTPAPATPASTPAPAAPADPAKSAPVAGPPPVVEKEVAIQAASKRDPSDVARLADFMDTRLTWTFGDDDVTKATGEAFPLSPNPSVGDRPQYRLFFDGLNSRFAGRENLSHLVLYKKMPGFIENLDTEAAMVLRVDLAQLATQTGNVNTAFYDSGSYLRLFYKIKQLDEKRRTGIDITLFPLDTDRFRLGYLYDLSWGGTAQYINQSIFPRIQGSAPGGKIQYTGDGFYVFAGFKTAQIVEVQRSVSSADLDVTKIQQTNYGFLGGAGVDFSENVRLDLGAGYFQQGRFEDPSVLGERVFTYGGSGRLVIHSGMPVPASVDFALYRNDPNQPMVIFRPEVYSPGTTAWAISVEGNHLRQNLKDFDRTASTKLQGATGGAIQATIKSGFARIQGTVIGRDLNYVVRNQPGFIPFVTLPNDAKTKPEIFFAFGADYYIEKLRVTPGFGGGVQLPATFSSTGTTAFDNDLGTTVVIRQQGNISQLPRGKDRVPIIQGRVSLKWDISKMMATVLSAQLIRDNNATRLEQASDGTTFQRAFVSPNFIGFNAAVQARF